MSKLLIITGASSGIGYQTAHSFLQNDWQVINLSRSICNIEGVTNYQVDLSDNAALKNLLDSELTSKVKAADKVCITHNAAKLRNDDYKTLEYDDFLDVIKINILAVQQINKALAPLLKPGSSIIYIGSTLSEKAGMNCLSYTATKHALAGMMKSTAQDLRGKDIHSCLICPGFTDTEMLRKHLQGNLEFAQNKSLFGRLIKPQEVAEFIYSTANQPITNGSVLHINLGESD